MKFCKYCGYGMGDAQERCTNCGSMMDQYNTLSDDKLKELSRRIKLNGIIWIIIGVLQVFSVAFAIVGVLNIISAINDIKGSERVFTYRVGLVQAYKPILSHVIVFAYNLIFGGVVGVIGSLYYFFFIRGYVMSNADYFNTLR